MTPEAACWIAIAIIAAVMAISRSEAVSDRIRREMDDNRKRLMRDRIDRRK